jgi:4-hydroxy-tetrahydrodipicolinate synthase
MKGLITAWQTGDIKRMQEINRELVTLNEVLFVEANPIPVKYILYKMGYILKNELRPPLRPASKPAISKIETAL